MRTRRSRSLPTPRAPTEAPSASTRSPTSLWCRAAPSRSRSTSQASPAAEPARRAGPALALHAGRRDRRNEGETVFGAVNEVVVNLQGGEASEVLPAGCRQGVGKTWRRVVRRRDISHL